jgi:hypothetical protein
VKMLRTAIKNSGKPQGGSGIEEAWDRYHR